MEPVDAERIFSRSTEKRQLCSNLTTVQALSGAILANLFHVAISSRRNPHTHCEKDATSLCQYQRDVANGTNVYKPEPGLSDTIIGHVKPIYQDLVKKVCMEKRRITMKV